MKNFAKPDFSKHTYGQMAVTVGLIREEVKRRNPIGVNMYTPYLMNAVLALAEISGGEKYNFTSECGPREPRPRKKVKK